MVETQKVVVIGGSSRPLLNFRGHLLRDMAASGHTVITVAPADEYFEKVARALSDFGMSLKAVPMARGGLNPWRDVQTYYALMQILRAYQPNVVLAYTVKPAIYGGIAVARIGGIRFFPLITGLGYPLMDGGGLKRRLIRSVVEQLYRRSLAGAEAVVFQNPDDEAEFRHRSLVPPSVASERVNGSGVDLIAFPPSLLPKAPVFLMLARLMTDKGVREFVAAADIVRRRFPKAVFRLAGGLDPNPAGIRRAELDDWIRRGTVEYLGKVEPVQPVLAKCRFYVLPSYREGTPRSVLEAMATGRPIITTDVPGCRETVVDGENGFLIQPRNAQALADAMIRMLQVPEMEVQRMADASLAIAREKFNVHKINHRMLEIMGL